MIQLLRRLLLSTDHILLLLKQLGVNLRSNLVTVWHVIKVNLVDISLLVGLGVTAILLLLTESFLLQQIVGSDVVLAAVPRLSH